MLDFIRHRGRMLVILILFVVLIGVVLFLNQILFPFLLASFLAYVLSPVIESLHHRKIKNKRISRGGAVMLVYVVILLILIGGGSYMVPKVSVELGRMIEEFPKAVTKVTEQWGPVLNEKINKWSGLLPKPADIQALPIVAKTEVIPKMQSLPEKKSELLELLDGYTYEIRGINSGRLEVIPHRKDGDQSSLEDTSETPMDLETQLSQLVEQGITRLKENMIRFLGMGRELIAKIVGSVFTAFLTFMVAGFILVDTNRILDFGKSLVPPEYHHRYSVLLNRLDTGLNGVVRGQLLICFVNGVLTLIGLMFIGVPFAFTLGIVAMVLSLIPIFGTIISSIPIVIMGLTISLFTGLMALIWILIIHFIEANFLNPKIMGTAAHIHPALIVFSLVTGEYMAGIAGALLAVPIFSILQTFFLFLKSTVEELELPSNI